MLLRTYPVGSIYMTTDLNFDPEERFGGGWEKLPDGVFLRNAGGNAGTVGQTQAEALPNLKCDFGERTCKKEELQSSTNLIKIIANERASYRGHWADEGDNGLYSFNAGSYNPIYKDNAHVTPVNMAVYMWIRKS